MFPQIDPSKMDPKLLMELSNLIRELPPDKLNKMQSIMHNAMAGFNVQKEMEEFEKDLPLNFRERLAKIMATHYAQEQTKPSETISNEQPLDVREARLTILRAVAEGKISPEEAEKSLFD